MDFKSLLNKLDSMEAPAVTPKAPTIPAAVKLNEDAELRVLSGRSTYVAEAKKKAEEKVDENAFTDKPKEKEMKVGDKKKSSTGGTIEKTKTGLKHTAGKKYGGEEADKEKVDESDEMKVGDKKKSSTGGTIEKTATGVKHTSGKNYSGKAAEKEEKEKAKKDESVDVEKFKSKFAQMVAEAKKKKPDDDGDGVPNWADEKPGEDDNADKKKDAKSKKNAPAAKKGMSDKQAKYFGKKKTVKESYEPKLTFREMMKLVVESGGQQQIDPIDQELFAWASRVAKQKLGEGMKAEVYAGMVYERMGGVFNMYDVLSEDQE
jgi:SpoU rRNA methylase family enzyme